MFPFRWLQYSIYHLNLFWSKQDPDIPSFTNIYFFFRVSSFLRSLFNLWFQRIYVKSNSIPRDTKFKQQKWSITQHPSPENLVSPFSLVRNFSIVSRKRGSRERKEGRHRGWEEDGREWRIEIYRFIGNRLRHGRVGGPFMKLPLRNIPLWKRLTPNRSLLFPSPPPTPRSANGTKREKLARAITEITDDPTLANQNFPVSSAIASLALFTIYCRQNAADFERRWRNEGGGGDSRAAISGLGQGKQVRR